MKIIKKLIGVVLMVIAPIISAKAFWEYINIAFLSHKPSYPFGKILMKSLHSPELSFLANYQQEILSIGVLFLAVSVLIYLSMLLKALMNLFWLALIVLVGGWVYIQLKPFV